MTNGNKGNYASAQLNLKIIYKKISILLEKIEEIYNQLFEIILGKRGENYIFEYSKDVPLEKKEVLNTLEKLQANGFSTKYILDIIGVDSEEYFDQSIYEIEELKLREKIIPPQSTYTTSGEGNKGRQSIDDTNNQNTIISKENGGNQAPRAGV